MLTLSSIPVDEEFKGVTHQEHIMLRPDSYIGSKGIVLYDDILILDKNKEGKYYLETRSIEYSKGLERTFLEILSNAADNVARSRLEKIDPGIIKIESDNREISIYNEGRRLSTEKRKDGSWNPEFIFSKLLTGSNLDDSKIRKWAGRNGYGAKLTNIFSKEFIVEIGDSENKNKYIQKFRENNTIKDEPIIKKYKGNNYVKITWTLDFEYFYGKNKKHEYNSDMMKIFMRHIVDVSFNCQIPIYYNNELLDYSTTKKYVELYNINLKDKNHILLKESEYKICIIDTPYKGNIISFVNGLPVENGTHIEVWMDILTKYINTLLQEKEEKKGRIKNKKNINDDKKKIKTKSIITKRQVKEHLFIIIKCFLENPEFDSQGKNKLIKPILRVNVDNKKLNSIKEWDIMKAIDRYLKIKDMERLSATDGYKAKKITMKDYIDASECKNESKKCVLFVCEGKSARAFILRIFSFFPKNERKYYGVFPLQGVPINAINASIDKLEVNKEIIGLKKVLGLQEKIDYSEERFRDNLRYGKIVLVTDPDPDGIHIKGLFICLFGHFYTGLLKTGFITSLFVPLFIVKKGKNNKKYFFTEKSYNNYIMKKKERKEYPVEYIKGLGSLNDDEDVKFTADLFLSNKYIWDDKAKNKLLLIFHKELSDDRKDYLNTFDKNLIIKPPSYKDEEKTITNFIDHEYINFSIYSCKRAIPYIDGFKDVHRKIIYVLLNMSKNLKNLPTVASLAGKIKDETTYNHGEMSLEGSIIKMAQEYPGSNNIPLIKGKGNFGTRMENGEDASAGRYTHAKISSITRFIFRKEDDIILEHNQDEGRQIEPKIYYPIVPIVLINGASGIGTGWSTDIPSFNPLTIIEWLKCAIKKSKGENVLFPKLIPWYKNFKGNIFKNIKGKWISEGIIDIKKDNSVKITELPLFLSVSKFTDKILPSLITNNIITDFNNYTVLNENDVNIKIIIPYCNNPSIKNLHLHSSIPFSNMILFDENNILKKYNKFKDIIIDFYNFRIKAYERRKDKHIINLIKKRDFINLKYQFIYEIVINKSIDIRNTPENILQTWLLKHNFPDFFLKDISIKSLTEKGLELLKKDLDNIEKELNIYQNTTIYDLYLSELEQLEKFLL